MHFVSAAGAGAGNLGGALLLIPVIFLVHGGITGHALVASDMRITFLVAGVWYLGFLIPLWYNFPEPEEHSIPTHSIPKDGWGDALMGTKARIVATLSDLPRYQELVKFLVANFFYSDGIGTVFHLSVIFASSIGISNRHVLGSMCVNRAMGFVFSGFWAPFATVVSPKVCYAIVIVFSGIASVLMISMSVAWQFYVLQVLLAFVGVGGFSIGRSIMGVMTPADKAAEFFGYSAVMSRVAGFLGPLLYGIISQTTGNARLGFVVPSLFLVVSMGFLVATDIDRGVKMAEFDYIDARSDQEIPPEDPGMTRIESSGELRLRSDI
eukprot:JP435972.1.p1 GENE.JP435972.1~~JP435972.1.p1  ORF type:complete len:363 (+),score=85.29 JP435972.1:122-1090(+)